jgi:asparagine synthase (glutamine-hydrolysing)
MAQRYGTEHHERIIRGSEVLHMLDQALAGMSEPVADSAMVPTWCLSKMAAEDGIKVLLSGTGGDEVFAGYSRYVSSTRSRQLMYGVPASLRRMLGHVLPGSPVLSARLLHPALDMSIFTGGSPALAGQVLPGGMSMRGFLDIMARNVYPQAQTGTANLYEHMQFDLQVYLPDLLLFLLDQLTMAHTVEGRVPLLDTELIAASYALQPALHADPAKSETRCLMRRMAQERLDPRTFTARKQGFSGPVRAWINANRDIFRARTMSARDIPELAHLQPERWWADPSAEQNPYWAQEVFMLYCFTTWYQLHGHAG